MKKKLYRSSRAKVVAGVCAGLGEYFEVDPVLVRALFVVGLLSGGLGAMFYIVMWVIMPNEETVLTSEPQMEHSENAEINDPVFSEKHKGTVVTGLILVGLGAFFLIRELFPSFSLEYVFPIMLIAVGAIIVFNALRKNLTSSNS